MQPPGEQDVFCPRCRYNLRGQTVPRCPECGLTFDDEQWRTGVLREHVATTLDRCDLWQPHLVLLCSLYELIRGVIRPAWLVRKLDLRGSLRPALVMLGCGLLWVYVLTTILIAVAVCLHAGASPAASLRTAALYWSPRLLIVAASPALLLFGVVARPGAVRLAAPRPVQYARIGCYWLPVATLYVAVPFAALLISIPNIALGPRSAIITLLGGLVLVRSAPPLRDSAHFPGRRRVLQQLVAWALWCAATFVLPDLLLPDTLEPPLWVYLS